MRNTEVVDPQGFRWVVRRRWTPRWTRVDVGRRFQRVRRRRRSDDGGASRWWDFVDVPDDFDVFVVIVAVILALLLLWFAVIPLLLVLFDVLVVFVLFVVGVAARVLLRRPWTIVATRDDGTEIEREVVGWRASRAQIESMRRALESGFDV
jgi:hypothetical protein